MVRVTRRGADAVHFILTRQQEEGEQGEMCRLKEGSEVEMTVDWSRRFDHMQQHSGMWVSAVMLGLVYINIACSLNSVCDIETFNNMTN